MKILDIVLWVAGLAALGVTLWQLVLFMGGRDAQGRQDMWAATNNLYMAIAAAIVACVCIAWAFSRRPHGVEEIHITK